MIRPVVMLIGTALGLCGLSAHAGEPNPWGQREAPGGFLFGNEIDTHQRSQQARDGSLFGFLYVRFTGVTTQDGYPVATHVDCGTMLDCSVGWKLDGKPLKATFLHHPMHDHPVFEVARNDIPQPGSYSFFHWLGQAMPQPHVPVDGYLLQLTAMNRFCFMHHGAEMADAAASCRDNGGIKVDRGIDMASHLSIVTAPAHGM
jgi:hypothetical protein